jgi:hypothetical protein
MGYSFFLYQNFFIKKKAHGNQSFLYGVRFCPKSQKKKTYDFFGYLSPSFLKKKSKKKMARYLFQFTVVGSQKM